MNNFKTENGILTEYLGRDTRVTVPEGITEIGDNAFSECPSVTEVMLPDSVTVIGESAFLRCGMLNRVHIPKGLTRIGNYAFFNCNALKSIDIPAETEYVGKQAFGRCESLREISVDGENHHYRSIDGNLYTKDGGKLIAYATGKPDTVFNAPENLTTVGENAFCGCKALTSVSFSDGLCTVEKEAFIDCVSLVSAHLPNTVTRLGRSVFQSCKALSELQLPSSLTAIPQNAFFRCKSLTEVIIPDSISSIGNYAFGSCSALTSVRIPDSVNDLNPVTFDNCGSLTEIFTDQKRELWLNRLTNRYSAPMVRGWLTGKGHRELTDDEEEKLTEYIDDNLSDLILLSTSDVDFVRYVTERKLICISAARDLLKNADGAEIRAILLNYVNDNGESNDLDSVFSLD